MRAAATMAEVAQVVAGAEVVDVHTHLFPPSHGDLMLWGIDELLTYHYLVSEYFMVAPSSVQTTEFFSWPKEKQADAVWDALFVQRSPVSEAARGVCTVLQKLGLEDLMRARDLDGIREWFGKQDLEDHMKRVFKLSKVKYCVMTNNPFVDEEAIHWGSPDAKKYLDYFKAALRIDPLLKGDWETFCRCLGRDGYPETLQGARQFLEDWSKKIDSVYFMASTPKNFKYDQDLKFSYQHQEALEDENHSPLVASGSSSAFHSIGECCLATQMIDKILVPVATKLNLPIALKLGACRGMNPDLNPCGGGDGVEVIQDPAFISSLCSQFPMVKFLVTFLSRDNQHQACVLANKFRNLHLYGCWWYCNNPSVIREITTMRVELLGSGFTAQHSDCRVLEQLLYKWSHSREVIGEVLEGEYAKLERSGWSVSASEVQRDVRRYFGGAYHEFLSK